MNEEIVNTDLIHPKEIAQTVESALHVFQGHHDALPDLMHDLGQLLLKASRRMSTLQLVATVGGLALGAIYLIKRVEDSLDDDNEDTGQRQQRPEPNTGAEEVKEKQPAGGRSGGRKGAAAGNAANK